MEKYNSIQEYASVVDKSVFQDLKKEGDRNEKRKTLSFGILGELASFATEIKNHNVFKDSGSAAKTRITYEAIEELGDLLWYIIALANESDIDLATGVFADNLRAIKLLLEENPERLDDRQKRENFIKKVDALDDSALTFDQYQEIACLTRAEEDLDTFAHTAIAGMTSACNKILLTDLDEKTFDHFFYEAKTKKCGIEFVQGTIPRELGRLLWFVAAIAESLDKKLSEIAAENARKVLGRNLENAGKTPLLDEKFPDREQFPRKMEIHFVSATDEKCRMYYKGQRLGDELTDNSHERDGYRFHDALHLGQVAVMGWSPVLRSLMKRKRKSKPETDENEDGARARIVDEVVVNLIYNEGRRLDRQRNRHSKGRSPELFKNEKDVSNGLLTHIKNQVWNLEVAKNSSADWVKAILDGYKIFNQLNHHQQGTVTVNLEKRTLKFSKFVFLDHPGPILVSVSKIVRQSERSALEKALGSFALSEAEKKWIDAKTGLERSAIELDILAIKAAVRDALSGHDIEVCLSDITVRRSSGKYQVSICESARKAAQNIGVICFRASCTRDGDVHFATVDGIGDMKDTMQAASG